MSGESVARLSEAQLDRLAEATWRAISFVEPELSLANFLDLAVLGRRTDPGLSVSRQGGWASARAKLRTKPRLRLRRRRRRKTWESRFRRPDRSGRLQHRLELGQALDQLTMPRFLALRAEWRRNPPVHWLVAAALKYRAPDDAATAAPTDDCGIESGLPKRRALTNPRKVKDQRWPTQMSPSASALRSTILYPESARRRTLCKAFRRRSAKSTHNCRRLATASSQAFSADPPAALSRRARRDAIAFSNPSPPTAAAPLRRCGPATTRHTPTRHGRRNSRRRKN